MSDRKNDALNKLAQIMVSYQNILGFLLVIGGILFIITAITEVLPKIPSSTTTMFGIIFIWLLFPFFIAKFIKNRIIRIGLALCWFFLPMLFKYLV